MERKPLQSFLKDYHQLRWLQSGLCAQVHCVKKLSDESAWASRTIQWDMFMDSPEKTIETLSRLLWDVPGCCVCRAMYIDEEEKKSRVEIYELMEGGALIDRLVMDKLTLMQCENLLPQLAAIMHHLHNTAHVVHGDLKPDNMLLSSDCLETAKIYLADWDMSVALDECKKLTYPCGTHGYRAPEQRPRKSAPSKQALYQAEMYTLGTIFYTCVVGTFFLEEDAEECIARLVACDVDEELMVTIVGLLERHPSHRLTAKQLFESPWIVASRGKTGGKTLEKTYEV